MTRVFTRGLLVLTALAACAFASPSRADDFKADVKFVQVGDVKLAYYMRGVGKPLVMVNGFVNGVDGFSDSPKVLNGASEFLLHVFGEAGKHARAAVSVNGLPLGVSVEVQLVLEVRD